MPGGKLKQWSALVGQISYFPSIPLPRSRGSHAIWFHKGKPAISNEALLWNASITTLPHQQQIRKRDFLQLQQTAAFEKKTSLAQSSELDTELLNIFRQYIQARHPEIPALWALESIQSSKMGQRIGVPWDF